MSRKNPSTRRMESRLGTLALKHVKPEHVDTALAALKEHAKSLPDDHPANVDNAKAMQHADRFFEGCAAGAPETAVEQPKASYGPNWRAESAALQKSSGFKWT